jgi:transglutaminase-like putative cysteine protease
VITVPRALNIPARYVFGYIPSSTARRSQSRSMHFAAWFGGLWHTFNARHNIPRAGRVVG